MKPQKLFAQKLKSALNQKVDDLPKFPGTLGDGNGNLFFGTGQKSVYVVIGNQVNVAKCVRVDPKVGKKVWVGYANEERTLYQILSYRNDEQSTGGAAGGIAPANRYRYLASGGGQDPLWLEKRAWLPLRPSPTSPPSMLVNINAGEVWTGAEFLYIASQSVDLTAQIPSTTGKAAFVMLTISTSGTIVQTKGSEVNLADLVPDGDELANCPDVPADTSEVVCLVRAYEGQTEVREGRAAADGTSAGFTDFIDLRGEFTPRNFEYIDFDLAGNAAPETEGRLSWNPDERTLDLGMGADITAQLAHELFFDAKNQTGANITNGTPVMFAGTLGASGRTLIQKAIANDTLKSEYMMGITTQDIDNGDDGKVTWFGKVRGIDTTGALSYGAAETWADGDLLWVSQSNAGYLTNVEPMTGQKILAASVIYAHSNGTILVRPTWDGVDYRLWNNNASAGRLWGGVITDAGSGNIDIAAGAGLIKTGGTTIDGNLGIPTALNEGQGSHTSFVEWDTVEDFPLAGVGYNIIFWDASEGEFAAVLKENFYATFNLVTDFTVGRVYYDGSTILSRLCGMNRWNFDRRVQMFGEERFPVERARGLLLSETGTRNIAITAGVIWAELVNRFSTDDFDSSASDTFTYWRRNGSGGWTATATQTQINNTQYDDGDGTLGTLTANRYGVHWVFVVHDGSVHVVYGQGDYTLAQAELTTVPATLPGVLEAYASFIGRIIIQKSASTFAEVRSAFTQAIGTSIVTSHNDLSGLQGGGAGNYYHIPASANASDFAVGDGSGGWEVKTLAETQALIGVGSRTVSFTTKKGLLLSNNSGDATNDIDVSAGYIMDSTDVMLLVGTAMTKRLDASWVAGTNQGGLFSGSKATSTWYHYFIIRKDSDGTIDYGFDTSVTAANKPAGYTYFRRIGSIYNKSTNAIRGFVEYASEFHWNETATDYRDLTLGTSTTGASFTCSIPTGVKVRVFGSAVVNPASAGWVSFFDPDLAPSGTVRNYTAYSPNTSPGFSEAVKISNTSAQLRYYVLNGSADWYTNYWEELWQT